jgi:uncharacterized protein with PIN domain
LNIEKISSDIAVERLLCSLFAPFAFNVANVVSRFCSPCQTPGTRFWQGSHHCGTNSLEVERENENEKIKVQTKG